MYILSNKNIKILLIIQHILNRTYIIIRVGVSVRFSLKLNIIELHKKIAIKKYELKKLGRVKANIIASP